MASSSSPRRTNTLHRERSAPFTSKEGFSVVAPMRMMLPFSTKGRKGVLRFASEDVGLADPRAMEMAVAAYQACHFIGMPECAGVGEAAHVGQLLLGVMGVLVPRAVPHLPHQLGDPVADVEGHRVGQLGQEEQEREEQE